MGSSHFVLSDSFSIYREKDTHRFEIGFSSGQHLIGRQSVFGAYRTYFFLKDMNPFSLELIGFPLIFDMGAVLYPDRISFSIVDSVFLSRDRMPDILDINAYYRKIFEHNKLSLVEKDEKKLPFEPLPSAIGMITKSLAGIVIFHRSVQSSLFAKMTVSVYDSKIIYIKKESYSEESFELTGIFIGLRGNKKGALILIIADVWLSKDFCCTGFVNRFELPIDIIESSLLDEDIDSFLMSLK